MNSEEDYFFSIKYELHSPLGMAEGDRYINDISGILYLEDDMGKTIKEAGRVKLTIVLLGSAVNDEYFIYDIFDTSRALMDIGHEVYDFEYGEFVDEILEYYDHQFDGTDLAIIDRIEILPEFRKKGLANKIIKDMYIRFSGGVAFFVLKAFPLQLEPTEVLGIIDNDWREKMQLGKFEKDAKKAKAKLMSYYKKIGFDNVLDNDLFFLNPSLKNTKIRKITFD